MIPAPVGHQCPTCVAEARREFRQGPGRQIAVGRIRGLSVTGALLAAIVAMYVVEIAAGGAASIFEGPSARRLFDLGALFAPAVADGEYWRLLSSMFLHAGLFHIAFNAYALWIFGSVVEQELGRLRFILIYFVTGLAAGAVSYAFGPGPPFGVGVGASGAIFGIFGAFVAYNYRRRDLALAAARLRSAMFIIVVNMLLAFTIPGIDWRAHLGGLGAGLVAGFAAEGAGSRAARRAILVGGFLALAGVTVALVAWRNEDLRSSIPFLT
jgi:membrane associated rhomboid family serine protease